MEVPAAQMCAVMGPSGVGKSTLLNCIAGLDVPERANRRSSARTSRRSTTSAARLLRRRRIGIVYQFFNLVSNLTARKTCSFPSSSTAARADEGGESRPRAGGHDGRKDHLPGQLSGGEMQLVSIARALVRRPSLVLADEPTGNVNVATGRRIMALLAEAVREAYCALLLVTHNPEDAALADRVISS